MKYWTIGFEYDDHQGGVYSAKKKYICEAYLKNIACGRATLYELL